MPHPLTQGPRRRTIALVLGALAAGLPPASAEDWPQFRGPTGQGISRDEKLPVRWDGSTNVAWRAAVPGKGWSSPVILSARVFLTTAVGAKADAGAEQSLRAIALDASSGAQLWDVEVFRQPPMEIHTKNSHASPTPLADGERVYVHFGTNGTAALDRDGHIVWRSRELRYQPVHGSGGSPVLAGDALIVNCDGSDAQFVAALHRATGALLWRTSRPAIEGKRFAFSTPLLISTGGAEEVLSPAAGGVFSLDPKTGKELWRVFYAGYSVVPRPVFGHGLIFLSTGYDEASLVAIRAGGRGDISGTHVAWRLKSGAPHNPSPLLVGDEVYVVSDRGIATCLDARTGKRHWQERLGGSFSASPLAAAGRLYFLSEEGVTVVVRAGTSFVELQRNALGERSLASPAASQGTLFIRTESHLVALREGS